MEIKLSNIWENYSELLNRIEAADPSLRLDSEYTILWNVTESGNLFDGLTQDVILNLLTSSDIIGELGTTVFAYTDAELNAIVNVISTGNNETTELIYAGINSKLNGSLYNGFGKSWETAHEVVADKYQSKIDAINQRQDPLGLRKIAINKLYQLLKAEFNLFGYEVSDTSIKFSANASIKRELTHFMENNNFLGKIESSQSPLNYSYEIWDIDELEEEPLEGAGYLNARTKLKEALGTPFTNNADWGGYEAFRVKADNDFTGYFVIINVDDNNLEFLERRLDAEGDYDTKIIDVFDFEQVDTLLSFVTDFEFIDAIDEFTNGSRDLQEAPFVAQPETYEQLLARKDVDQEFVDTFLLGVDKLTPAEMSDLGYVEDRIDTHLEMIGDDDLDDDDDWADPENKDFESEGITKLTKKFGGYFVHRDVHQSEGPALWISGPPTNYNVGNFVIDDENNGDFRYVSIMDNGDINLIKMVEFEDVDELITFIENDLATPQPLEEVVYDFTGTTLSDINKVSVSEINNYTLLGALLNLVYDNYERSDKRDELEAILEVGLDLTKYPNLTNVSYGKSGGDKTIPPALLKQFYNIVKSFDHTLEWVKKYEWIMSQPKTAPELKIKYVAVDKSTYETDKSGLEFTVEINGKKATGFWTPKYGYNHDGMDIDELRIGEYERIKIFNGGGSARSYEISSTPVKKEKQPKDLRFTGPYYDTAPMGQDFIKKIREGLAGPTKTGATLTPEFLAYFMLNISI